VNLLKEQKHVSGVLCTFFFFFTIFFCFLPDFYGGIGEREVVDHSTTELLFNATSKDMELFIRSFEGLAFS
jgi:hypothetical protein